MKNQHMASNREKCSDGLHVPRRRNRTGSMNRKRVPWSCTRCIPLPCSHHSRLRHGLRLLMSERGQRALRARVSRPSVSMDGRLELVSEKGGRPRRLMAIGLECVFGTQTRPVSSDAHLKNYRSTTSTTSITAYCDTTHASVWASCHSRM